MRDLDLAHDAIWQMSKYNCLCGWGGDEPAENDNEFEYHECPECGDNVLLNISYSKPTQSLIDDAAIGLLALCLELNSLEGKAEGIVAWFDHSYDSFQVTAIDWSKERGMKKDYSHYIVGQPGTDGRLYLRPESFNVDKAREYLDGLNSLIFESRKKKAAA